MTAQNASRIDTLWQSDAGLDPELAEILERYLIELEQGRSPDRAAFLSAHAEYAERLESYLPWVELLCQIRPSDATPAANPAMPAQLGEFRILRELGRGGMGIVYEAEQVTLARHVALKVLPFASMLDDRQLTRFQNEALAAAQLHHAHIVPIFAVGCESGLHYHVMQLVDGQTLAEWIERRQPRPATDALAPPSGDAIKDRDAHTSTAARDTAATENSAARQAGLRQLVVWIIEAAEALDHAHNQGVVHRDVKPSNLMISREGKLWVTDFGLARSTRDAAMTATGELLGTLRYMSPEQLRSKPGIVDHRTDIFSLGLTLFEMLALRPAFDGQSQQELFRQIEHEELASLRRLNSCVPRDLDSIVAKATAKVPESRYASARDMAEDLRAFLDGRPTMARPATWGERCEKWVRRHSQLAAAAAVTLTIVLTCVLVGTILVWRAQRETQTALALATDNQHRAEDNLQDARAAVDDLFTGVAANLSDVPGAEHVRAQLLHNALTYYQRFIARAADDDAVRHETAAAYYRSGQIKEQLGDDAAALVDFTAARSIWSEMPRQDDDDSAQRLALCENNLGLIHLRAGRIPEAEFHLREALRLGLVRAERSPDDKRVRHALALGQANLGQALAASGRTTEARECLLAALDMQSRAGVDSVAARGDLASMYNQLGYVCREQFIDEAEQAFRRSVEEFERLSADEPHVLRWRSQCATTLNNLAAMAAQAGRADEAESAYQRAIDIQRRLAEQAPHVAAYERDLAVSRNNLGFYLSQHDRQEAALEQLEGARAGLSRLAQAHPESPEYASRLGAVCHNLALACEGCGLTERARAAYNEAIQWQSKALAISPQWREAQQYLDEHTANLQRLLAADEKAPAAALGAQGK